VSLWDRDARALAAAAAGLAGAQTASLDVSDESQVQAALAATVKALGKVDALVCSAGITGPNLTTWDYPVSDWKQVLDINLTGVFLCNKALAIHMRANDYGRIVNIASIAGKEGNPNASAYSASKAGVISLTKSLGKELARTGIRVNCVTPAAVKTGMFAQMTQAHIDFMLSKIPWGVRQVEEIAALVAWLCTETARSPPARCSTCRAVAPSTELQEACMNPLSVLRPVLLVAALASSAVAQAQIFRAYLASDGSDSNPCTLPAPCRLLPAALAAVAEQWRDLDARLANYNVSTVDITKSVTLLAIPARFGSVVDSGGPAVSIATVGVRSRLRNLVVVPLPGAAAPTACP
jgi:3-oxoacyl-[acyl-carrier protein] reductase